MASAATANLPFESMGPHVDSRDAVKKHLAEADRRAAVLRALLGIAKATGREVILPRMLCYCDFMWKEMRNCRVGGAETMRLPFDCPMDHVLDTPKFFENTLGVEVREPNFLTSPKIHPNLKDEGSIARVKMPITPLDDAGIIKYLQEHESKSLIELDVARASSAGLPTV